MRAGRGAVLWVAHFSFNSLAAKKALHQAGFAVAHLSRPEHGFSTSRFGIAALNPIRVRTDRRFLADPIIADRPQPAKPMRRAHRRLAGLWAMRIARYCPPCGCCRRGREETARGTGYSR